MIRLIYKALFEPSEFNADDLRWRDAHLIAGHFVLRVFPFCAVLLGSLFAVVAIPLAISQVGGG